ncbi:hypothetical protein ACGRHY_27900 [Streptomyces sp. HK10]|uniref:hypothetical protein n=1 Tax=Streptomyces sp. HK10 TaxID=3373255 RepID=UPI00374880E7
MNASVRRAALTVADSAIEGADMATVLAGGAIGAWTGYTYYPETWSSDWRLVATGAIAVIGAITVNGLTDLIFAPLRRLLAKANSTARSASAHSASQVPATLDEGLAQVIRATEDDAARRAASAAFRIGQGGFLQDEGRWRGYENGEASFYLAPGVWLHYRAEQGQYSREHSFTLLTGDGDQPVAITGIDQIRHHIAARAVGLPAAAATVTAEGADDLTGLHTV